MQSAAGQDGHGKTCFTHRLSRVETQRLGQGDIPLLFIHGKDDLVAPLQFGVRQAEEICRTTTEYKKEVLFTLNEKKSKKTCNGKHGEEGTSAATFHKASLVAALEADQEAPVKFRFFKLGGVTVPPTRPLPPPNVRHSKYLVHQAPRAAYSSDPTLCIPPDSSSSLPEELAEVQGAHFIPRERSVQVAKLIL
eukprot:CAMPEP_0175045232 /NCGR_PEP_ID=MMETSP0052_2-20121109/4287_1 /TAXON_ID=51329 ORGANISM="Polytomella parva, Strain SAG 63-3" /NCGR_SAMPLE_ID=MMETSP0052_2 /ASSEMBLY_ACC=CAM_ASM_000194 /LENGTH=192 /DNA_ID=CAMNT_0016308697 /DNA_START=39 /DNA_END=615 /DNA_ORIENTATION=-